MTLSKMTAWELRQIFKNKKFTYSFIIQFFVILAIIPLFDTYSAVLEEPQEVILPTSTSYVPVAVTSSPLEELIQEQSIFRIYVSLKRKDSVCWMTMWSAVSFPVPPSSSINIIPRPGWQNFIFNGCCNRSQRSPYPGTSTKNRWSHTSGPWPER